MMAENEFLIQLAAFLQAAGLAPAPALVGARHPAAVADLPAVVLSLDEVRRRGGGLAEGASVVEGALSVTATIDLANPVLLEEPSFRLLSDDRLTLVLPHGGWVQADGSTGPLSVADLQVSVAGGPRAVVNAPPGAGEVRPDPTIGTLRFGAPLPPGGDVAATYFLGQWERTTTPIAGLLRIDVRGADAAAAETLSAAVLNAVAGDGPHLPGLRKIVVSQIGPVGAAVPELGGSRGRALVLAFEYDHERNTPESSGGVIRRVPITSRLNVVSVDRVTGALVTGVVTETD